ncbi:hypothetical protein, partial [Pontibacterium sp.]|uniref:hypothetical protein n=1 Tax=Pontibacterium sp. TaxID=2036026 RepID=UPI003513A222
TGFFVSVFCGLVGAKYRDLSHGLSNVFQLLFVLTPVIYPPELLLSKGLWFAVYFNPLSSFIQIVRVPIVDQSFAPLIDYLVVFVVLLIAIVSSKIASSRLEKRIAYYL